MSQIIIIKRMMTGEGLEDVLRSYPDLQVVEKHNLVMAWRKTTKMAFRMSS